MSFHRGILLLYTLLLLLLSQYVKKIDKIKNLLDAEIAEWAADGGVLSCALLLVFADKSDIFW